MLSILFIIHILLSMASSHLFHTIHILLSIPLYHHTRPSNSYHSYHSYHSCPPVPFYTLIASYDTPFCISPPSYGAVLYISTVLLLLVPPRSLSPDLRSHLPGRSVARSAPPVAAWHPSIDRIVVPSPMYIDVAAHPASACCAAVIVVVVHPPSTVHRPPSSAPHQLRPANALRLIFPTAKKCPSSTLRCCMRKSILLAQHLPHANTSHRVAHDSWKNYCDD